MLKLSDVFAIPLSKINFYFLIYWVSYLITVIPGIFLWLITLGGFRYFHLMGKLTTLLVKKSIEKYGLDTY